MQFRKAQLDNGLKIIAEVNPAAATMAAGFFVRTGSRDETPNIAGVSHFLEHMVFKGTARRSAADVNIAFDQMGANYNAFTSEENTVYFASVLPEFQAECMDLLCDILRPSLRQDEFAVAKGVILEEIAMYEDHPQFRLYDNLMRRHFESHPLGNVILGSAESVSAMARDDMQAYFDRRYSPTNVTLVGVGNLDFDELVAQAGQMCASWRRVETDRAIEPSCSRSTRSVITDAKLTRQNIGLMCQAPSGQDQGRFAAQLLANVLGDATGSRLYYALVDPALADEAQMTYSPMDGTGAMMTTVSTDPQKTSQVLGILDEVFRKFLDQGPGEAELQAAKNKIASQATLHGEQPMGRLTSVGFDWVYRGEYVPLSEQIDAMFAVSAEDILTMARKCDLPNATMLALGPLEKLPEKM
jgi:predicted Zn-dependent peptidase